MKDYIEDRVLEVAKYIIESKSTIRRTAKVFGVSKSTIHKDMTERLPTLNPKIASQAKTILDLNKAERHIRGGRATRLKYKAIEG
ncbi:sporulation transcriptional regulator SpoIIID [Clostridium frigoris]|uniref:Sporulation transcriptional regulator SpoIIID n=1 Tax=Clostridium frigoris TaxID=205327 RepID=A0ABS6BTJ5_9CLOT|nr:sporulation transcriptional regulator SpoIIID [Clostridium frigoris]MBU3159324.1 sporulation transcriptional regulator SpoIIID [Clostridium frigoris]